MHARHPFMGHDMRTHLVEQSGVGTLGQEMIIHRPQHWPEAIRIDQRIIAAIGITRDIAQRLPLAKGDLAMEQPSLVQRSQLTHGLAIEGLRDDRCGSRQQDAGGKARVGRMNAKRGEGIVIAAFDQPVDLLACQHDPVTQPPILSRSSRCPAHIREWFDRTKTIPCARHCG